MDLGAWWKARRWKALLDLIDLLPQHTRLAEAKLSNPDEARRMLEEQHRRAQRDGVSTDDDAAWTPPLYGYDTQSHFLREIRNFLAAFVFEKQFDAVPPPRTALDEQRALRREHEAAVTIAKATPRFAHVLEDFLRNHGQP